MYTMFLFNISSFNINGFITLYPLLSQDESTVNKRSSITYTRIFKSEFNITIMAFVNVEKLLTVDVTTRLLLEQNNGC